MHWGKGRVSVYERAVFLEPDFEVGPGPAFHVLLVPKAQVRSSADVKDAKNFVDEALAELKAGKPVSTSATRAYGCTVKYPS